MSKDVRPCLGNFGSSENPCSDCELRKVCEHVTKRFILRAEVVSLIDSALADIEEA